jgi:hypothetical protein
MDKQWRKPRMQLLKAGVAQMQRAGHRAKSLADTASTAMVATVIEPSGA